VSNLTDRVDIDPLDLLHCRMACTAKGKLIECYRQMLATDTGLQRYHATKKAHNKGYRFKEFVCGTCARTKITKRIFSRKTTITHTNFLSKVTADIAVYLNCPSREGYRYVLTFVDEATKYTWSYGLMERTSESVLRTLKNLFRNHLPAGAEIQHFHTDGGKELIAESIKDFLRSKGTKTFTFTPTDTPQLNSVSERKFRTLGEMALAMLTRSGLPKIWWWKAYQTAEHILRRLPTRTAKGYMTPMEAIPGGETPSWKFMRTWGAKAYVLKPKADRRKDWDDKAQIGYFVGYGQEQVGWEIYLPASDTFVTAVNVLFDERIPERAEDYFRELDEAASLFTLPEAMNERDFQYLVGTYHIDDEDQLLYVTKRVVRRKGVIVVYRACVTGDIEQREEKTPIHVQDVVRMFTDTRENQSGDVRRIDLSQEATVGSSRPPLNSEEESAVSTSGETSGYHHLSTTEKTTDVLRGHSSTQSREETEPRVTVGETNKRKPGKRQVVKRVVTNLSALGGEVNQILMSPDLHLYMSDARNHGEPSPTEPIEPNSNRVAMNCPEWREWVQAKEEENEALRRKAVMRLVDILPGMHIIKSKYVFKIKKKYGKITRYKARLVALGYDQVVDAALTFSPVVKPNTVRLLLALAQVNKMQIHQIDISNAFCCADVEGEVHIHAPDGMEIPEGKCFKLDKALYGLKQSPRLFNKTLDKTLKRMNFAPTISDPCLYQRVSGGKLHLILVYVDDILIASESEEYIEILKEQIKKEYDITDLGPLDNFLNAKIRQYKHKITMSQTHYCKEVLETFKYLVKGKTSKTPLPADVLEQLAAGVDLTEDESVREYPYRQVIGALLYMSMYTKPEIAYAVGVLSRFNDKKTEASCKMLTHLLRYLNGHPECEIEFNGSRLDMHGFSDADWGSDLITRRSTTGYIVFAAGGPISWQSKLQTTVATSSLESEYMALYSGIQELVWLRGVLREIGLSEVKPTPFMIDSKSALDLAGNPVFHKRSKHIDIKYHWLREHAGEGGFNTVTLYHCGTLKMSADIFTKSLCSNLFFSHAKSITGKRIRESEEFTEKYE
jgi:hypothetical protein